MPAKKFACTYSGCGKAYTLKDGLREHIKKCHSGKKYFCRYQKYGCELTFTVQKTPWSIPVSTKKIIFICSHDACKDSTDSFDRKEDLDQHVKTVHGSLHPCPHEGCGKGYADKGSLGTHIKKNLSGIEYPCRYQEYGCELTFTSAEDAREHSRFHRTTIFICPHPTCQELKCSFDTKEDFDDHAKTAHNGIIYICHYENCDVGYKSVEGLRYHVNGKHRGKVFYCKYRDREGCERTFASQVNADNHASDHEGTEFACNYPECEGKFPRKDRLRVHINFVHLGKTFTCDHTGCTKVFPRRSQLEHHIDTAHLGKRFSCTWHGCGKQFVQKSGLRIHFDSEHLGLKTPCEHPDCDEEFDREDAMRRHFRTVHLGLRFHCEDPECDKSYKSKAALDNHTDIVHLGKRLICKYCGSTFTDKARLTDHEKGFHTDEIFLCKYRKEFDCQKQFPTVGQASYHSESHYPMICQVDRCLAHLQERKMVRGRAHTHYNAHVAAGHCEEGQNRPLKVVDRIGTLVDSKDEENGVLTEGSVNEEPTDVQETEESADEEIEILSGEWIIEMLTSSSENDEDEQNKESQKNQDLLRDVHRTQNPNYRELNLKCPGPGVVMDGLVLGTELCPNNTTISSETGLLARNHGRVHLRIRCAPCQGRKDFNKVLLTHDLGAKPGQTACEYSKCSEALWEGTRYCKDHMKMWAPESLSLCEASMKEIRDLFLKATSKQWSPVGSPMARILQRVKLDENATSDLLFVDTEFSTNRHRLYQLAICDSKERKKLDCFPIYSEGVNTQRISQSSSSLDFKGLVTHQVKNWENKMSTGQGFAIDRGFSAKMVTEKLDELVSNKTTFIAWGNWAFDVAFVREWLEAEKVSHNLPANDKVCLLLQEFKSNLKDRIGNKCFKGHSFPLTLPFLFALLFQGHDLVGRNHDALVDAQQTAILHRLFLDLCKPPKKRVLFKGMLPIALPGMQPLITNVLRRKAEEEPEGEDAATGKKRARVE